MDGKAILGIYKIQGVKKVEMSLERVITWTLIFTNAFFISYFFAKLFQWI
jgi:hypothetical protein